MLQECSYLRVFAFPIFSFWNFLLRHFHDLVFHFSQISAELLPHHRLLWLTYINSMPTNILFPLCVFFSIKLTSNKSYMSLCIIHWRPLECNLHESRDWFTHCFIHSNFNNADLWNKSWIWSKYAITTKIVKSRKEGREKGKQGRKERSKHFFFSKFCR